MSPTSLLHRNPPSHHNYHQHYHYNRPNRHHIHHLNNYNNNSNNDNIPSLNNRFHLLSNLPSKSCSPSHNRHKSSPPFNNNNNNNTNVKRIYNNRLCKGIILSDSMCSQLRTDAIKKLN